MSHLRRGIHHGLRATIALSILFAETAAAQQPAAPAARPDTNRAVSDTVGPRPELKPPLSPRRAFLYSLLVPGYSQSVLGRNRTGAIQIAFETAALIMIRQSAADLREARRNVADSIIVSYVDDSGRPAVRWEATPFSRSLVRSRESHLEDWIAVLAANHLFSAADAYVAALLWDLPAEVALRAEPRRSVSLALRLSW